MGTTSMPWYEKHSVDDPFARGARLFDRGEFFEAHEVWEERWRVATDKNERQFLHGLIQVAAAFHKLLVMQSGEAASRLLAKGLAKLDACPARVQEMDLATFRERPRACGRGTCPTKRRSRVRSASSVACPTDDPTSDPVDDPVGGPTSDPTRDPTGDPFADAPPVPPA
ncbi:MAG: DUF309 domain-containing protein, partial [Polyangiaceae bacterium]